MLQEVSAARPYHSEEMLRSGDVRSWRPGGERLRSDSTLVYNDIHRYTLININVH